MKTVDKALQRATNLWNLERKYALVTKVFLVLQRNNCRTEEGESISIIDAKLTYRSAKKIVDAIPGTYIVKVFADKL